MTLGEPLLAGLASHDELFAGRAQPRHARIASNRSRVVNRLGVRWGGGIQRDGETDARLAARGNIAIEVPRRPLIFAAVLAA